MPHLTRTTQKSLFETTVGKPESFLHEAGAVDYSAMPEAFPPKKENPVAVGVDMTPLDAAKTRSANYPHYDLRNVDNLPARVRGHHY